MNSKVLSILQNLSSFYPGFSKPLYKILHNYTIKITFTKMFLAEINLIFQKKSFYI